MSGLTGKVVIVTGGAQGMAAATASPSGVNVWCRVTQAEANHERLAKHAQEINAERQQNRQCPPGPKS
ncbi:hypothetical protein [Rhodococcus jostii]|uniref:hypothetical protein n=1 Tax=Rhodococcus jostii TaxID=132919 RepID=UPI0011D0373C|nr:hypothetical protein [Rhodococcus jostii]